MIPRVVTTHGARAIAAALLLLALFVPFVLRADTAIPPYAGYVTDTAHVFEDARRAQLEGFLDQVQKQTGVQFAVLTMPELEGEDADAYKVRVFKKWGIGDADRDDGLLLLVAMKEHRIVFETGYGLEGTLPDGWEARMLRQLAVPRFREGHPDEGIIAAVLAASQRIAADKHVTLTWDGRELRYGGGDGDGSGIPAWVIALILFLVLNAILRAVGGGRYRGSGYGGYGGWGGGFGGGFGGGGGGGGGSSFGGFGGGSSGGGGGGASW